MRIQIDFARLIWLKLCFDPCFACHYRRYLSLCQTFIDYRQIQRQRDFFDYHQEKDFESMPFFSTNSRIVVDLVTSTLCSASLVIQIFNQSKQSAEMDLV